MRGRGGIRGRGGEGGEAREEVCVETRILIKNYRCLFQA